MTSDKYTRLTLLEKIRDLHDDRSWEDFANYYQGYIYVVLKKFIGNHHDCQDLTQEVLMKAWKSLPTYQYRQGQCKFRTWLCTICRNSALNFLRKQKSRPQNSASELSEFEAVSEAEIDQITKDEWEEYIFEMAWNNIEQDFSSNVKDCFKLYNEGLSTRQIAEQLNLAESSVRVNKKRLTQGLYREVLRLDNELG